MEEEYDLYSILPTLSREPEPTELGLLAVYEILAATGLAYTRENICMILEQLYDKAKWREMERKKIQRTQKGRQCRNEQKRK